MKRGKKLILLLAILVIAAGAAVVAVKLFPDGEAVETAEEPETTILSLSSEELSSIGWTYEEESISFTNTRDGWEYSEDPAFPLNEISLTSVLSGIAAVSASKTIEAPEDVSQYGLDEPACVIVAEPAEGDTVQLQIGSETDMGGERYISIGDGNVYLTDASILDAFSVGLYDLVQNESIPYIAEADAFEVDAETQTLIIEHKPDSGLAYSNSYEWFAQSEDGYITLDTELTESLIESVTLLSWIRCADYAADESELADFGLDIPAATVTVHYIEETQAATNLTDDSGNVIYETKETEESLVLELGAYVDSYCYARLSGSDMVYLVDASVLDGVLYTNAVSLRPDEVIAVDWNIMDSIDITLDDKTFSLEKGTVPEDSEEETDDSTDDYDEVELTYETAWLLDGSAVPIEDALAELTGLSVQAYADGESPARSEELHIVIHQQNDSYPEIELSLYEYDSSVSLAILNGGTATYVSRSEAASLIATLSEALTSASEADAEEAPTSADEADIEEAASGS